MVENVKGAQPWVGRAAWSYGSFYLWGDLPALIPSAAHRKNGDMGGGSWFPIDNTKSQVGASNHARDGRKNPGFRFDGSGKSFQSESVERHVNDAVKGAGGSWANGPHQPHQHGRNTPSGSKARKAASAKIAKIPLALSSHIARVYSPAGL